MNPEDNDPPMGRVCAERITAYPNGCIGSGCSRFECCRADYLAAVRDIREISQPHHDRRKKGNKMNRRGRKDARP